jgi:hypothetical protein
MDIINDKFSCNFKVFLEYAQLFIGFHLPVVCGAAPGGIVVH